MEIAIPAIALGSLYILSNKTKEKEGYTTQIKQETQYIPQNNMNHNSRTSKSEVQPKQLDETMSTPYTDKYMQPHQSIKDNHKTSLNVSGVEKPIQYFTHNNMQPFFKSNSTQRTHVPSHYLDYKQGAGVHYKHKQELGSMFSPEERKDTGFVHGMPSQTSFIQGRINPSRYMSNVKPWEEIRVGPGLGKENDLVHGSGGFNSGLEARERWMPKSVDELRTKNNPKVEYGGTFLGGKSKVTNRGSIGMVQKKSPETFYVNTPDRYLTTVGQVKAPTMRDNYNLKEQKRVHTEYYGAHGNTQYQAPYTRGYYHESSRPELDAPIKHISNVHAPDRQHITKNDYGIQGYQNLPNQRSSTRNDVQFGAVSTFAKAVVAPIMDIIRPTRKENVIGNPRISGNMGQSQLLGNYVKNEKDIPRTTLKEMTDCKPYPTYVKSYVPLSYSKNTHHLREQNRDDTHKEFVGSAKSYLPRHQVYDYAYNAHLIDKEPLLRGREPKGSNVKLFNGQDFVNIDVRKRDEDRVHRRQFVPQHSGFMDTPHNIGKQRNFIETNQSVQLERTNPELLQPFRNNPYTKSLHSY